MRVQRSELALLGVAIVCALVAGPGAAPAAAAAERPTGAASQREKQHDTREIDKKKTTARHATAKKAADKHATAKKAADKHATASPAPSPSVSPSAGGGATIESASISLLAHYVPDTAPVGQTVKWTTALTLTGSGTVSNVSFALYLPTGVVTEGPVTTDCGGTFWTNGSGSLYLNGATMSNSASTCTYTADVHATAGGTYAASTGIANNFDIPYPNYNYSATLTAIPNPTLSGGFSAATVVAGSAASLDLALGRTDTDPVTGMAFTVALPTGVTVGSSSPTSDCGGTLTAIAGQSSIALAAGTLALNAPGCAISVPLAFSGSGVRTITGATDVTGRTKVTNGITTAAIEVYPTVRDTQTITFTQPVDVPSTTATVSVDPTASSALTTTVTSSTTDVCTVAAPVTETSGKIVHILKPGMCSLTAAQAGNGYFDPAASVARTFAVTPPAPSGVTATAGDSSITVSWPASSPVTGITGYKAIAEPGPATCTTTGAVSCVLGAEAGTSYTVTVVALAGEARSPAAGPSTAVAVTAPVAPATPPVTNLTLTTNKGRISTATPGSDVTFIGNGFAAFSTVVITMYSAPRTLGTAVTDANGVFSKKITIPSDLADGAHTALAQGAAPDGTTRSMALALTVSSASDSLPVTGAGIMLQLLIGCALTLTGTGLVRAGRPRRT